MTVPEFFGSKRLFGTARRIAVPTLALLIAGCATASPPPINPRSASASPPPAMDRGLEGDVIVLALSGGGARSTAFSLGALQGLRDLRARDGRTVLDHVRIVTAVSGGSIMAAYYGQHGPPGLDTFRAAYLDKDWTAQIHTNLVSPLNWARAAGGGLNDQVRTSNWLDREVFAHGLMGDLTNRFDVRVVLNATDLYNGTTFAFTRTYFDALCSDLESVRIADAVAASMAFPGAFHPVVLQTHSGSCPPQPDWVAAAQPDHGRPALVRRTAQAFANYRNADRQQFLHLADGGIIDNLGLSSLRLMRETAGNAFGPLSERDAVRVSRMTFLVVNAEQTREATWQMRASGPNGPQALSAILGIAIEAPNRGAYDAFALMAAAWERALRDYRCRLDPQTVERLRGSLTGWDCRDVHLVVDMISFADLDPVSRDTLGHVPTSVSLPSRQVDALIAAGRRLARENPNTLALTVAAP